MTAEVSVRSYVNHSIGRDTCDNGNSFFNQISTALLLSSENERLKTYKNWRNKNMDPKRLSAAGFYYLGKNDDVKCFRCGIGGRNWLQTDNPMEDHMKWNETCPFVRENRNRNLEAAITTESSAKGPSRPEYIIVENRLPTFENWPVSMKQKPAELAAAGFYYCGVGDRTKCFFCGGGLKNWAEEDDPWEQHALWFPQCHYLLMRKSSAFVENVRQKHKNNLSPKQDDTEKLASYSTSKNAKESPSAAVEKRITNYAGESSSLCKICYVNNCDVVHSRTTYLYF